MRALMLSVIHMFQQFGDRAHKFVVRQARNACIDILMETGLCKPKKTYSQLSYDFLSISFAIKKTNMAC